MENNQEHKIDKIFKHSLDNQSVTPPADAWMAVHTYTIGQEQSKKKVWLRYASLGLLVLLFSGLGVWYFIDNQSIVNLNKLTSVPKKIPLENINSDKENTGTVLNLDSIKGKSSLVNTNSLYRPINHNSILLSHEVDWSGDQPRSDKLLSNELLVENTNNDGHGDNAGRILNFDSVEKSDSVEKFTYSADDIISSNSEKQIEIIESKSLIFNDLSEKMQKESKKKINKSSFEDKAMNQDSVVEEETGKKLNLKHPIITFGLGFLQSYWIGNNNYSNINEVSWYDASGVCAKIGIGWKINKKLRMSVNLSTNSFNLSDFPYKENVLNGTSDNRYKSYLKQSGNDKYYSAFTNFGYVNIPVSNFNNFPTTYNNVPDSVRILRYTDPHSMRITVLSINSQYDIVSKIRKKRNKYGYQIYGLADLLIQRQTGYSFVAFDEKALNSNFSMADSQIFSEQNHFDSSSEYTYGIRVGFGFRYQFSRRWNFYLESSAQSTINSWFKVKGSLDYFTITQRVLSLQAGINLNL